MGGRGGGGGGMIISVNFDHCIDLFVILIAGAL